MLVSPAWSDRPLRPISVFLPVFLLFVWQITAIAVKPQTLGLAVLMTLFLLVYAYRVLGRTPWLRRCRLGVLAVGSSGSIALLPALRLVLASGRSPGRFTNPWVVFLPLIESSWLAHRDQCWRKCFFEACSSGWSSNS